MNYELLRISTEADMAYRSSILASVWRTEEKCGRRQESARLRSEIINRDLPKTKQDIWQHLMTPLNPSGNYMYH